MVSGSNDVRHRRDENSARSDRGCKTVSQRLLRTIQQAKDQGNPPAVSGSANLLISSTRLLKRNERYASTGCFV
ncbi:unnamed protein product [Protopolystoma xenopodis]|uniref:Uncharacterized protein n=1 Tax=Protopolystoma xenopodis TaxID=117903 RepID=A0A3S4ZZZ0_9PLAT|nr:unnamed protein product [Protopolystoma xenopodis]